MTLFWILGALLAAAALALALRPLYRRRAGAGASREAVNLAVYRDQLRELDTDRASGKLAAEDYDRARRELEKRLLEDVDAVAKKGPPASRVSRKWKPPIRRCRSICCCERCSRRVRSRATSQSPFRNAAPRRRS